MRRRGLGGQRVAATHVAVALLAAASVVAGCATPRPPASDTAAHSTATEAPLAGRLAIRIDAPPGQPARQASMRFELAGNPSAGRLDLSTPVGTTVAQARWQGERIDLQTSDGERRFESLDALTRELLGEALPVVAVLDWLRGRPWPGAPHELWSGGDGKQSGFEQIGWRIDLSRYDVLSLVFTRAAPAPKVDVRVRLDPPSP